MSDLDEVRKHNIKVLESIWKKGYRRHPFDKPSCEECGEPLDLLGVHFSQSSICLLFTCNNVSVVVIRELDELDEALEEAKESNKQKRCSQVFRFKAIEISFLDLSVWFKNNQGSDWYTAPPFDDDSSL